MTDPFEISVRLGYVKVKDEELWVRGGAPYAAAQRAGRAAVKHVHDELIRQGAIDSGELYNSIDYAIYRQGKGVVISVGPMKGGAALQRIARFVEYGTRGPIPHAGPKVMPIQIKGGPLIFRTRVKGQESKPYLRNALKRVRSGDFYE